MEDNEGTLEQQKTDSKSGKTHAAEPAETM